VPHGSVFANCLYIELYRPIRGSPFKVNGRPEFSVNILETIFTEHCWKLAVVTKKSKRWNCYRDLH